MSLKRKSKLAIIFGSIGGLLLLVLIILSSVAFILPSFWYTKYKSESNIDTTNWMSNINDDTYISDIVMPASHDSCTKYCDLPLFTRTQQYSIKEQLEIGIRVFDMRLCETNGKIKLVHSSFTCKKDMINTLYLDNVLNDIYNFLDTHSSETVVFVAKNEGDTEQFELLAKAFDNCIKDDIQKWYIWDEIPMLKQVRGKIVLLPRFPFPAVLPNINWPDQANKIPEVDPAYGKVTTNNFDLYVQDAFKYSIDDKWDAFLADIPLSEKPSYVFDYLSTTTTSLKSPFGVAKVLNKKFMNLDKNEIPKGWLFLDFVSIGLTERIIEVNL